MKIAIVDLTPKDYKIKIFADIAKNLFIFLKKNGLKVILTKKIIYKNCLNIILGTTFLKYRNNFFFISLKNKIPKNTILYNLESYFHKSLWFGKSLKYFYNNYKVVDYSYNNAKNLSKLGIKPKGILPVILNCNKKNRMRKDIDILFVGSLSKRRKKIIKSLKDRGVKMYVSTNVSTPQRLKKLIERSKIFLNIHYNGPRELEQARISPNISNNCVILSEKSLYNDENIFFQRGIVLEKYSELVKKALYLLKNKKKLTQIYKKNISFAEYGNIEISKIIFKTMQNILPQSFKKFFAGKKR